MDSMAGKWPARSGTDRQASLTLPPLTVLRRKINVRASGKPARDYDTIQLPKREGADRLLPGVQSTTALF
jgi:hypothetical protein